MLHRTSALLTSIIVQFSVRVPTYHYHDLFYNNNRPLLPTAQPPSNLFLPPHSCPDSLTITPSLSVTASNDVPEPGLPPPRPSRTLPPP